MDSTVLVFGIIALIAIAVLARSFLKFRNFGKEEGLSDQSLKVNVQPKSQPKPTATRTVTEAKAEPKVETKVETKAEAKVETKLEAKVEVKPEKSKSTAEQPSKLENVEKPAMAPVKVQGPSEEDGERVARIERILIKHFENQPGGVVIQGTNGDGKK